MTPDQCRAARAMLRWDQATLASTANVSETTVRNFEGGRSALMPNNERAIVQAFTDAGIEFIPGGVRRSTQ